MTSGSRHGGGTTYDYELPSLGADMDEGRVIEWKVEIGDTVRRGDVLASVETEKSDIDIEIWSDGIVDAFLVELNELIPVGTPVMRLRAAPIDRPDHAEQPDIPASPPVAASTLPGSAVPATLVGATRVAASPFARRIAAERGVNLDTIDGTGPNGAIVAHDVERASLETPPVTAAPATPRPAPSTDPMRALIADRMATSNREIPHYYLERHVDLSALTTWIEERNLDRPMAERLLPAAAYIRAVAIAAARHPELNGFWVDGGFRSGEGVHVAMAISLRRGGLVTPKVADTDQRSVDEIMATLREVVSAARTGSLRSSWMTGATITITNLGDNGADLVHGVISPPQVALVGFGGVSDRPWVIDGALVVRPILTVTLAADHRATDGGTGSRFLATIAHLLEQPEEL